MGPFLPPILSGIFGGTSSSTASNNATINQKNSALQQSQLSPQQQAFAIHQQQVHFPYISPGQMIWYTPGTVTGPNIDYTVNFRRNYSIYLLLTLGITPSKENVNKITSQFIAINSPYLQYMFDKITEQNKVKVAIFDSFIAGKNLSCLK